MNRPLYSCMSWHAYISLVIDSDDPVEARREADRLIQVLHVAVSPRQEVVRDSLEVFQDTDFDTKITRHRAYVRLNWLDFPDGEVHKAVVP